MTTPLGRFRQVIAIVRTTDSMDLLRCLKAVRAGLVGDCDDQIASVDGDTPVSHSAFAVRLTADEQAAWFLKLTNAPRVPCRLFDATRVSIDEALAHCGLLPVPADRIVPVFRTKYPRPGPNHPWRESVTTE